MIKDKISVNVMNLEDTIEVEVHNLRMVINRPDIINLFQKISSKDLSKEEKDAKHKELTDRNRDANNIVKKYRARLEEIGNMMATLMDAELQKCADEVNEVLKM